MKKFLWLAAIVTLHPVCLNAFGEDPPKDTKKELAALTWTDPDKATAEDPDFSFQGEYGEEKADAAFGVQVVALGGGQFEAYLLEGGLPGLGWTRDKSRVRLSGTRTKDALQLVSDDKSTTASVSMGKVSISRQGQVITQLSKVDRKSPTLGAKAGPGAIVLFDGTSADAWQNGKVENGLLANNDIATKQSFTDYTLHIEFRTPYKPYARGQARGNSGVYHQGRYETQVLDSFGLDGKMDETGGLYSIAAPKLNMCLPPLAWQTYDVDFTAARFDGQGELKRPAKITVRLNGVTVHTDQELPQSTPSARIKRVSSEPGPIFIQHHGNPVYYRNIWLVPKDEVNASIKTKKLLVVTITDGFRHGPAIEAATKVLPELAAKSQGELAFDFMQDPGPRPNAGAAPKRTPDMTDDVWSKKQAAYELSSAKVKAELPAWQSKVHELFREKFTEAELSKYDGIIFCNTTGDLPLPDGGAFLNWVSQGKAFVGVHAATDTLKAMKPYTEMINGSFAGHPWGAGGTYNFVNHEPSHPVVSMFGSEFLWKDEIYQYDNFNPASVHVLISLDMAKSKPQLPYHVPVSWLRNVGKGRLFYTNLGHNPETWSNTTYQQHIVAGIRWSLNLADGNATPNPELSSQQAIQSLVTTASVQLGRDASSLLVKAISKAKANPEWAAKIASEADSFRKLPGETTENAKTPENSDSAKMKLMRRLVDEIER